MATKRSQMGLGGAGLAGAELRDILGKMVLAFDFTNTPASDDDQIVAAVAGTAPVALTVLANPDVPRNLFATFAGSYDGGNITIVGTDQYGKRQTEVLLANAGSTRVGSVVFKSVVSVTRSAVGVNAATVKVGTGTKIGIGAIPVRAPVHIFTADGVSEAATLDATYGSVVPTTAPDGAHDYKLLISPA